MAAAPLYTGPVDKLDKPITTVQWHDITDDDHYTELHDQHRTIHPTNPADLTAQFTAWINAATIPKTAGHPELQMPRAPQSPTRPPANRANQSIPHHHSCRESRECAGAHALSTFTCMSAW